MNPAVCHHADTQGDMHGNPCSVRKSMINFSLPRANRRKSRLVILSYSHHRQDQQEINAAFSPLLKCLLCGANQNQGVLFEDCFSNGCQCGHKWRLFEIQVFGAVGKCTAQWERMHSGSAGLLCSLLIPKPSRSWVLFYTPHPPLLSGNRLPSQSTSTF